MRIIVNREHIEQGACALPNKCMIAAAIKDQEPDVAYVSVRTNGITVTHRSPGQPAVREHYAVPLKAARAIIKFDLGEKVNPFSFEAKLIDSKELPSPTPHRHEVTTKARKKFQAKLKDEEIPVKKDGRQLRVAGV